MNVLVLAGSALATITYFPFWRQIKFGEVKQNFLTWFLYGIIDSLIFLTIIVQDGNFLLSFVATIGSFITAFFIARSGAITQWILFMVFGCMIMWYFSGSKIATILSTLAMTIASIPQLVDAWKNPQEMPFLAYISYFLANSLSTLGGNNWSIEERFYPASATIVGFISLVFIARKFFNKETNPITISRK